MLQTISESFRPARFKNDVQRKRYIIFEEFYSGYEILLETILKAKSLKEARYFSTLFSVFPGKLIPNSAAAILFVVTSLDRVFIII